MRKLLKMLLLSLVILFIIFFILILVVPKIAPQFGGKPIGESLKRINQSQQFANGRFHNLQITSINGGNSSIIKIMKKFIKGVNNGVPEKPIQTERFNKLEFQKTNPAIKLTWFGHSTVLLNINGLNILTDPVLSERASPFNFMAIKSFEYTNSFKISDLPIIDIVLISHDHYDHLDYKTILELKKYDCFYIVPLGVAAHLLKWGISETKIIELDWNETFSSKEGVHFISTPARHFSGRGTQNRNSTLWCSYVITAPSGNIFFGGDSGYGSHFKTIGETYGPFDLTILESGQYNENWPLIHMMPEQCIQANIDLKGKAILPIHWGKFKLSLHTWTEPIMRLTKSAKESGHTVLAPVPGKIVTLSDKYSIEEWWLSDKISK